MNIYTNDLARKKKEKENSLFYYYREHITMRLLDYIMLYRSTKEARELALPIKRDITT